MIYFNIFILFTSLLLLVRRFNQPMTVIWMILAIILFIIEIDYFIEIGYPKNQLFVMPWTFLIIISIFDYFKLSELEFSPEIFNLLSCIWIVILFFYNYLVVTDGYNTDASILSLSTLKAFLISLISFIFLLGLELERKRILSFIIQGLTASLLILTIGKNNILTGFMLLALLLTIFTYSSQRKIPILRITLGLIVSIFLLNYAASLSKWNGLEEFILARVLSNDTGELAYYTSITIRDGARFTIWGTLINDWINTNIISGIGMKEGYTINGFFLEDHNIIVYYITRFGLFGVLLVLIFFSYILNQLNFLKDCPLVYWVFLFHILLNALVGTVVTKPISMFLIGLVLAGMYKNITNRKMLN